MSPQSPQSSKSDAAKNAALGALKQASDHVLSALNRADEIGGEVRDFVQDKVLRDERYIALRSRWYKLRGKSYESRDEQESAARQRAEELAKAAPLPASEVVQVEREGMGDPELPAQIFGRDSCPWTGRAITLMEKYKADYDYCLLYTSDAADE